MTDRSNQALVMMLMRNVLPQKKADEVASWIIARGLLGPADRIQEKIQDARYEGTRDELADSLWKTFCERCGEDYVFEPSNLRMICDQVAAHLSYEDADALREHNPERHSSIISRLEQMVWRSHFLTRQNLRADEKAKLVGKFIKDWREDDDEFRKFEAERKLAKLESASVEYTSAELFGVIAEKLEADPSRHYSYNQMWRELGLPKSQLMKTKDHLEKLADTKSKVYTSVVKYKPSAIAGKQMPDVVYQWAPARRRLGERPTKNHRDSVIKEVIRELLANDSEKTTREIVAHVRAELGTVGNEAVTLALADLIETTKEVTVTVAAHRAFVHRLAERKEVEIDGDWLFTTKAVETKAVETKPVAEAPLSEFRPGLALALSLAKKTEAPKSIDWD